MRRWLASLFARDTLMERGTQHPFTLVMLMVVAIAQACIYVAEFSYLPLGRMLGFDASAVHLPSFFFFISHYAPLPDGTGFSALDFAASLVLWFLCGISLLAAGPLVEGYLGLRKTFACFVACCAAHLLLAMAVAPGVAFSTAAFCAFLLSLACLIHLEQRDLAREPENDFRLLLLIMLLAFGAVAAGFMPHESYDSLLPALAAGPALALLAFVFNRKLQMRDVHKKGQGTVGTMYFVDEFDLLTREEIQSRMDRLLAKISQTGMQSLAPDERRFLANASGRLKPTEPRQASR
jgi:hypothetical protein